MKTKKFNIRKKLTFILELIVKVKNDDISALASQLAYDLLLSFFPFIIFLITLVGFSNLNSNQVLDGIRTVVPGAVFELTSSIVVEVIDTQNTGLLGISILLALWTSSTGFRAVIKGVNKAYNFKETRSFIKVLTISILSILALATIIILALTLLVFGNVIETYILTFIRFEKVIVALWNFFKYAFVNILMILIFAGVYRFSSAQKLRWRAVLPGSIFSTVGWIVLSYVFSFYIDNLSNYSRFYGSLGAVFILMTWLFLISMIFILGVEINCVLDKRKKEIYKKI